MFLFLDERPLSIGGIQGTERAHLVARLQR
jgi:hypothetical protein